MRALITGGGGKLGGELVKLYPNALHPPRRELDITDGRAVSEYVALNRPDVLIHCAALTGVRRCEENKQRAWDVNVGGTENLVGAVMEHADRCLFVYISTACVFYGDRGDYVETDLPHPKNFYSLTKLLGEFVVRRSGLKEWLIIRTNFAAREPWPYPRAFVDRYGTYLFADDLARAIRTVVEQGWRGVLHVHGEEKLSMFELAKITTPEVEPMRMDEYAGPPLTIDMSLRSIRIKPFKLRREVPVAP